MAVFTLLNVSKKYQSKEETTYALKNVTVSFQKTGLVMIVGKSGCGKSTLLNMLALIDSPSKGQIFFLDENVKHISSQKAATYRKNHIAMVFQHYQLIGHYTVYQNIALPLLIQGKTGKQIKKSVINLLQKVNLPTSYINKKVDDLSGGEKQRVAILRAIITNPSIILCDEPTGALDSNNSSQVMDILKEIAKEKLVIVVTHDHHIVDKYASRIIEMDSGRIIKDQQIEKNNDVQINKKKTHFQSFKTNKICFDNFRRRFKKNIVSIISLVFCLTFTLLIFGFSYSATNSIKKETLHQFDYGVMTFYKEYKTSLSGTNMSLIKMVKPSEKEIKDLNPYLENYHLCYNFDVLINPYLNIKFNDKKIEGLSYVPIYSFEKPYVDHSLLYKGTLPKKDNLSEVVINNKAYELLKNKLKFTPLNQTLVLENSLSHRINLSDEQNPYITDHFYYSQVVKIVGVVKEIDFLQTPKIFYPYVAMEDYLKSYYLNNLSAYLEYDYSYYDRIVYADNDDQLNPYSYRLFLKDYQNIPSLRKSDKLVPSPFVIECNAIKVESTLMEIINALTYGMSFFVIIAFIGVIAIFGIINYSHYMSDKKMITIFKVLGALSKDIIDIYLKESVLIGLISSVLALLLSTLLTPLINQAINRFTGFEQMVNIPLSNYMNIPYLLPIGILILTFIICIISTAFPIIFSKKIVLKEELKDE